MSDDFTEIVAVPGLVFAHEKDDDVHMYRSPLVKWEDPQMAPVRRYLAGRCYVQVDHEPREDPEMMFGSGVSSTLVLLPECPGETLPHTCVFETLTAILETPRAVYAAE